MSRIDLNVVATGNFGQLESQLIKLKAQIAAINTSMSTAAMINPSAMSNMKQYSDLMSEQLRSTGMFQTKIVSLTSETEKFGQSLQKGNLRLGDYFRNATGYIRNQQTEIQKLAREQVRLSNSTTLAMGDGRAMVITPSGIDEAIHKQQILNEEYRVFRQVVAGGSTQLINWGKNTQWAGRQLTVGLTVPLTMFGVTAAKTFMEADKQLTRLTKVYGDASKGVVDTAELKAIREQTLGLAKDIAGSMGVAAEETLGIAADIAATGVQGNELLAATSEAMRLSVLGEVDRQDAMKATLSIQSVFKKDTEGLTESINFLNAVENQTSTSLNDLTVGIVKAGPVVNGLGGSIEDLALMMVAMREGGVPAAEAANAIKSSLASLINPTKQTTSVLNTFGVDLVSIVDKNAGNVVGTLTDLQGALSGLDDLSRQRAIEQIFGKFQFSRINALLSNLGKAGSQTEQVLSLAGLSVQELASNADRELKAVTESVTGRFQRALESLKANLIPVGEVFTQVGTLFLEVAGKILEIFNSLPEPVKKFVNSLLFLTGLAGPIIMITGVFGNFLGYILKGVSSLMAIKQAGRGVFEYFTPESIAARDASELITKAVYDEKTAIDILNKSLEKLNQTLIEMRLNSTAAVGSMQGLETRTMAAAEGASAAESGKIPQIYTSDQPLTYTGGEVSHLTPESILRTQYGFSEKELQYLLSPSSLLGGADLAEAKFQQTMGDRFAAQGYYDPSTMGTRTEALKGMAGGGTQLDELITKMSESGMARLYPTMEEHTAMIAKYQVGMEQLFHERTPQQIRTIIKEIDTAIASGGPQGLKKASEILKREIGISDEKLESLVTSRAQEYRSIFDRIVKEQMAAGLDEGAARAIASREMQVEMTKRERDILAAAPSRAGFARSDTMARQGTGMAIMAISQELPITEQLTQAATMREKALRALAAAESELAIQQEKLTSLSEAELVTKRKYMKGIDVQNAYLETGGKIYAKINGQWEQLLANGTRKNLTDKKLIASLELRAASERKVVLANRYVEEADKREALASQRAAEADLLEAEASKRAAQADLSEATTGGSPGIVPGAAKGKGLAGRMAGGLGALGAASMVTSMIPAEQGSGLQQGLDVVGGIGMGASIGAAVGSVVPVIGTAIGAAAGGVIGGIGPVMSIFSDNAKKAADAVEQLRISSELAAGSLGSVEQNFLGINIKELEDIPLEAFGKKTAEAQSQLDQFKDSLQAAKDAEEASTEKQRISEISSMSNADELINSQMFQSMLSQAVMGGASKDQIALMMEGYLDIADKEYFSKRVIQYLDSVIPDDASAAELSAKFINGLASSANKVTEKMSEEVELFLSEQRDYETMRAGRGITVNGTPADFSQVVGGLQTTLTQDTTGAAGLLSSMMEQYNAGNITSEDFTQQVLSGRDATGSTTEAGSALAAYLGGIQINGENILQADPKFLMQILSSLQQITYLTPDVGTLSGEVNKFNESTKATAESLLNLTANTNLKEFSKTVDGINFNEIDTQALAEVEAQLRNIPEVGPELADFFGGMIRDGIDSETAFKALKLAMSGTVTDLDVLISKARDPIRFEVYYDTFVTGPGGPAGYTPSGLNAELPMPGVSDLVSAATQSGGSGGSTDTSEIEDAYDKQIKKQDQLIEKIKEEREERQKLYDLEKEAFDFAMQEQDLKNQIARARAEGNTAEAAMLQAQLDNTRAANKEQEAERKKQEQEDKRIKQAEKRKESLSKAKQASLDEAKGGGGGGEGLSDAEIKKIEERAQFLENKLSSTLEAFSKDIESSILNEGLGGFFDSAPVTEFTEEMVKLGVPIETVKEYLDTVFDGFIANTNLITTKEFKNVESGLQDLGFEGEQLADVLGNTFAILQDDDLTKTEKIALIEDAFINAGMSAGEAETAARKFYNETGKKADVTSNIDSIADAWYEVGQSAKRAALLQVLANDVATGNLSADVVENRLNQIDIITNPVKVATGGPIFGPGTTTSDSIPALLSNGEYVIRASSVSKYGKSMMDDINHGKFADGGFIQKFEAGGQAYRPSNPTYSGGTPTYSGGYTSSNSQASSSFKPTYSGGTPTYSKGYKNANSQAYSKFGKLLKTGGGDGFGRPGIDYPGVVNNYDSSDPTGIKSFINSIRVGAASILDSFWAPFRVPMEMFGADTPDTTPLGRTIGGSPYTQSDPLSRGLSAMSLTPFGRTGYSRSSHMTDITGVTSILGQGAKATGSGVEGRGFYTGKLKNLIDIYQEGSVETPWRGLGNFVISGGSKDANIYRMSLDERLDLDKGGAQAFDELTEQLKSKGYQAMEIPFRSGSNMVKYISDDVFSPSHLMYQGRDGLIRRNVPDLAGANPLEIIQALGIPISKIKDSFQNRFGKNAQMPAWMQELMSTNKFANGGYIENSKGGKVIGPGGPKSDVIPALLSNGEYVIKASSVDKYGTPFLDMLNVGKLPAFASGGYSKYPGAVNRMSSGGSVLNKYNTDNSVSGKESEYNINVYVTEPNASADEIANKIMQATTRRDKMNRTGIRL